MNSSYGQPPGSPPGYPPGSPSGSPPEGLAGSGLPPSGFSPEGPQPSGGFPLRPPKASGQEPKTEIMAIVSLVCGIVALLMVFPGCCCGLSFFAPLSGIAAVVLGYMARSKIKEDPANLTGDMLATVGMICGGVSLLAFIIFLILFILRVVAGAIDFGDLDDLMDKL